MTLRRSLMSAAVLATAWCLVTTAAEAGAWSRLPVAVSRLQADPSDVEARRTVRTAQRSVIREAAAGHVEAVEMLIEVFQTVVAPLPERGSLEARLKGRVVQELLEYAARVRGANPEAAGAAWALTVRLRDDGEVPDGLRRLLAPPGSPDRGQVWISPVDGAELVWLPSFRLRFGCTVEDPDCRPDERRAQWVTVPGLWFERTEVTNERYVACVDAGVCTPPKEKAWFIEHERARHPVVHVSWRQARTFARWAGRRLPSEVEWERAARGMAVNERFPWGTDAAREAANVHGTFGADVWDGPAPVGSFEATGWGLWDMAGNVWEWCLDVYHPTLSGRPPGAAPWSEGGRGRVIRGGSWRRPLETARVSERSWLDPGSSAADVGFRCVIDPEQVPTEEQLESMARVAFTTPLSEGSRLARAKLDVADRTYLERRAVTWLVLEGRLWAALPGALTLLARDSSDPVAGDLLRRIEQRLRAMARAGEVDKLSDRWDEYRRLAKQESLPARRIAELRGPLAEGLVDGGGELLRRGEVVEARACAELAATLDDGANGLAALLRRLPPEPGHPRVWAGDGREMVWIPSGEVVVGRSPGDEAAESDELPTRTVRIEGLWLDRTEVTNDAYRRCVQARACSPPQNRKYFDDERMGDHPVVWVSYWQAEAYARWADKRLPSEAEWEVAARAGGRERYPWGDVWRPGLANGEGAVDDRWFLTAPVGRFPPNEWGLFDIIGNAAEWTADVYHPSLRGAPSTGRAWAPPIEERVDARRRVLRGGSYGDGFVDLRVTAREGRLPHAASSTTGFRCAADARRGQ